MKHIARIVKWTILVILLLGVGFFGMNLLFSDFAFSETIVDRVMTISLFYVFFGMVVGFMNPRRPWIATLISWGSLVLVATLFLSNVDTLPWKILLSIIMLVPLGLTMIGSYGGSRLRDISPLLFGSKKTREEPGDGVQ